MQWTWPCWRLIDAQKVTFTEVTEKMSIVDVLKLNDTMNAMQEAEAKYRKKHEKT